MIFRFRQFSVLHGKSSMKVGTDAVLLGVWTDLHKAKNIIDIGAGCGIIALIAAQKTTNSYITAIDIDKNSADEAKLNFDNSKWTSRLEAINNSFQNFAFNVSKKYDRVICNPPFFHKSTPSPIVSRHIARHSDKLSINDFFENCKKILSRKGKISIIIPSQNDNDWETIANEYGFFVSCKSHVFPYFGKSPERTLLEFITENTKTEYSEIFIREAKNSGYTKQYIELTKDFYLDLLTSQR